MARDNTGATGVTNHYGEVFAGNEDEMHPGLIVTDAAVIPASLGVNPFATITALAERSVHHYAKTRGLVFNTKRNGILDLFGEPKFPPSPPADEETALLAAANSQIKDARASHAGGFGFTEVMSGFIHRDSNINMDRRETYELAYRTAKSLCESARFFLSVHAFNVSDMVRQPDHSAMLTGTFVCPTIEGSPFMVQRGEFNLFVADHKAPGTRNFTYDFYMRGVNNRRLHFHGYKVVDSSTALSPVNFWKSTSTLYVTISEPRQTLEEYTDGDAWRRHKVVAKGMMHINPMDFASQILTLTPTGSSLLQKAVSATRFLNYFTKRSLSLFLAPLTPLEYPSMSYNGYVNDTPATKSFVIVAEDGVKTRLHMWEPNPAHLIGGQVRNLFMIPGAAVDHQIYALPTIPYNAVNYFTRAGYRVFITVHRIGQLMVAQNNWTTFDARLDIKACLKYIREHYSDGNGKDNKIYTIAHCMGSVAFSCGLLDSTIPADWILGVTCSQVFMNPMWYWLNMAKVLFGPIPMDRLYTTLAGSWFSCSTSTDDSFVQRAINQILRFYPDERKEICNNASCHRCSLVFGR
jgi:hypothetical protein